VHKCEAPKLCVPQVSSIDVRFVSRVPVRPRRERPFPNSAPVANAERPVQVFERSLEILIGERPVAAPQKNPAYQCE